MSNISKIGTNYVHDVLDEIALEGLDGITLEGLWLRLSVRQHFGFKIDNNSKIFLWAVIKRLNDVKFYEIPEARPSFKFYDFSIEADGQNASLELDEIYPYCSVKNVAGVLGSCQHYFTRIDVTIEVIQMSLKEVESKWNNRLVIVASQESRNFALLGNLSTPNLDFSKCPTHYEILERIGRCRHLGLATCGKGSIQSVVEDSKSIFHYLKFLYHHKVIKKQQFLGNVNSATNASKVYLTRFFWECLNENMLILQTTIEELKARPNYTMLCGELYSLFDAKKKNKVKKFKKMSIFKKYVRITKSRPYRSFFPNASQAEWERKSKNGERLVRCFQLINPDVEVADIFEKECDADEEEANLGLIPRGIFYDKMPILSQAYHHIKNSKATGVTQVELAVKMGLHKRYIRSLIKRLVSEKYCKYYIENDGRRRCQRFIVGENIKSKAAASELAQILSEGKNTRLKSEVEEEQQKEVTEPEPNSGVECEKRNLSQLQEENIPYRTLRRIGMVIKSIKNHGFRLLHQIIKYINEEEIKEGLTARVDRLTINRILQKLEKDQLIKIITLTGKDKVGHTVKIYTEPTFELDDKLTDTLYHTHSSYNMDESMISDEGQINLEKEFSGVLMENLAEMRKMFNGIVRKPEKSPNEGCKESELIYSPKFIRLNILHDLLFHLVYDYTGVVDRSQEEMMEELSKTTGIEEELKNEMPKLYGTQLSSYMFVPPLARSSGKLPGWFLISDLLIRMPLSVMVKVFRVNETCTEFWSYVRHPIRKHFLVRDLPLSIREIVFNRKNQLSSLYCDLRRLCFMGLLQFGAKFGREYYQTFLYLNRRASLLDTRTSPPEYFQVPSDVTFEVKPYFFNTKSDVKKYWIDMFDICMATNLGVKSNIVGKEILAEREMCKESLKKLIEPKNVEKTMKNDNGSLPGDNLGAAGLDSIMFSFLRSNWTGPINKSKGQVKENKIIKIPLQKAKKEQLKRSRLLKKTRRKKVAIKTEKASPIPSEEQPQIGGVKRLKEREVRLKRRRKTSYDETDMEALKLMNTLRVTWSTAEDNLLLVCRVAIMFLCPNPRVFVRIPWIEVRRVLQQHLPESRNKTHKAIARRMIYMLKNPTTVRSVNLCLEELKEMPEAEERFDCSELLNSIKPSAPNVTELQNQLFEKFYELVAFLKDRFINNTNLNVQKREKDLIPDSLQEFLDKFQMDEPPVKSINVKFIRENVIRAILMSSLSCRADKTSSAVQLFDIYRQYDDDELQSAIKRLHIDKVITITRKAGGALFKRGKILPLSFTPYKFSFAFQHLLNMKYGHNIFTESFSQINQLLLRNGGEEFEVDPNECNLALFLLASKGLLSFRTVIPDQIIAIDSGGLSDATYSKMLERYCEMLRFSNSNSKVVCTSGKIISRSEDGETLEIGGVRKRSLSDPENVQPKKQKTDLGGDSENEQTKSSDDITETNEEVEEQPVGEGGQTGGEKVTRSSRVILYMMREQAKKEAQNDSGKSVQESCVVNASKVLSTVEKDGLELYSKEMEPKISCVITKSVISRSVLSINLVDEDLVAAEFQQDEREAMKKTLDFICSKKELGATAEELKEHCNDEALSRIVRQLIEAKVIIKSGIEDTRYISQKYSTPWLLSSFKMTRLEREKVKPKEFTAVTFADSSANGNDESARKKMKGVITSEDLKSSQYNPPACSTDVCNKVKVVIRPWIRIDGSLNRKVLDRFLGTVLGFVMSNPGVSMRTIMNRFSPAITPVWTKDLIEILYEIGCITLTSFVVMQKATLFSKSTIQVSEGYTGLEDDRFVVVEAKIDAVTLLGLFIGKKAYSKDFLIN